MPNNIFNLNNSWNTNNFKRGFKYTDTLFFILLLIVIMSMLNRSILTTLMVLPCVVIAITIHEFGHALMAYILGDRSTRARVSLNPLKHIDIFGLISLVIVGFGWGKPVEVNSLNYNRKYNRTLCNVLVALAGPIFNLLLAFIVVICIRIGFLNSYRFVEIIASGGFLSTNITYLPIINIMLAIFNLLPVPPLDGYKAFYPILPTVYTKYLDFIEEKQSILLICIIMFLPWWRIVAPISMWIHEFMYNILGGF